MSAKKTINELRRRIHRWNHEYYVDDNPTVSDAIYDESFERLKLLEMNHPKLYDPLSPTQQVGGVTSFSDVTHLRPMLSLDNLFKLEEVNTWVSSFPEGTHFCCEPKIDGLAVSLIYRHGKLVRAVTRGDGVTGEDVTVNAKGIKDIPHQLVDASPELLEVRGEVYMSKAAFDARNTQLEAEGKSLMANPRNAAAGALRTKDTHESARRNLSFYAYELGVTEGYAPHDLHHEVLGALKEMGLPVSQYVWQRNRDLVSEYCSMMENIRDTLPMEIDGVVIKIDSRSLQSELGVLSRAPKWAKAYKFPAVEASTILEGVEYYTGRTGVVTPVATLRPVKIGGVTVTHATLHNFDEMERLGIRINDRVIISRAGDVIPKIIGVLSPAEPVWENAVPDIVKCPTCSSVLNRVKGQKFCMNRLHCSAQIKAGLIHFVSRGAMNIDGMGEKLIEELVDKGIVHTPADLYRLTDDVLGQLDRMGKKKVSNILNAIKDSKETTLQRFIYAMGIPDVGEGTALRLSQRYGSVVQLANASKEELMEIPDIGEVVADSIVNYFTTLDTRAIVDDLLTNCGIFFTNDEELEHQPFEGNTFVITGSFEEMSREEITDFIIKRGGKVSKNVSKNTTYLLLGNSPGSNLDKALKLGTEIYTLEKLLMVS